jgi:hypothetical protein
VQNAAAAAAYPESGSRAAIDFPDLRLIDILFPPLFLIFPRESA